MGPFPFPALKPIGRNKGKHNEDTVKTFSINCTLPYKSADGKVATSRLNRSAAYITSGLMVTRRDSNTPTIDPPTGVNLIATWPDRRTGSKGHHSNTSGATIPCQYQTPSRSNQRQVISLPTVLTDTTKSCLDTSTYDKATCVIFFTHHPTSIQSHSSRSRLVKPYTHGERKIEGAGELRPRYPTGPFNRASCSLVLALNQLTSRLNTSKHVQG